MRVDKQSVTGRYRNRNSS